MPYMELSHPHPAVWVIAFNSAPDNRLHPAFLAELAEHLDTVEAAWRSAGGGDPDPKKRGEFHGAGTLILTGKTPKFFSNGLRPDMLTTPNFFENWFDPVTYRIMTFPLVTVAAINGHAFAGGMVLALCCDFRVMTNGKGMLCMNEIVMGVPLPNSFNQVLTSRLSPRAARDTALGKRWKQSEALAEGILDEIVDDQGEKQGALLKRAAALGLEKGAAVGSGAWGVIKDGLYHQYIEQSAARRRIMMAPHEAHSFWKRPEVNKELAQDKAKL